MNKIGVLIKNEFQIFYNRINKTSKNKKLGMGIIVLFALPLILASLVSQSYFTLKMLLGSGAERLVIDQQILTLFLFSLMFTITNSMTVNEKDSDFLLSLPITKTQIIISKTAFKFLFDFVICFIILFPISVLYFIMVKQDVFILINSFLVVFVLPFTFIGIEYLINSFINSFAIKFKYFNTVKTLISTAFLLGFVVLYSVSLSEITITTEGGLRYFFFSNIGDIILNRNYLNLLFLFLASAVLSVLGVFTFSLSYGKKIKTFKEKNNTLSVSKNSSIYSSLIKKELKTYFNSTIYLINTIIGYLILIFAPVALFFVELDGELLKIIAYGLCAFSLATCSISNASLSLEGKNFWILKSSPIDFKKIVYAKALTNFLLVLVSATLSFIIILISNRFDFIFTILLYMLCLSCGLIVSFVGIIVNLLFPKLDFENEQAVVKQSASVGISLLSNMVIFIIFPAIYFILFMKGFIINIKLFILLNVLFLLVVFAFAILFIEKKATKLINKL